MTQSNENHNLVKTLIVLILINLSPHIISTLIIPGFHSTRLYSIVVITAYFIQLLIIVIYYFVILKAKLSLNIFIYSMLFSLIQLFTVANYLFRFSVVNYMDLLNIVIKFFSFITLIGMLSKLKLPEKSLYLFMKFLVILGLSAILFNFITYRSEILNIFNINSAYEVKFNSFFINRNTFAQLLLFSFSSSFLLYIKENKLRYLISAILIFANLIITFSRGAILTVIVFIFIYFAITMHKKPKVLFLLFSIPVCLCLGILFLPEPIKSFILKIVIRPQSGTTGRSVLWGLGIDIWLENNILLGVGSYNGIDILQSYGSSLNEFHNFYIETLVGGGILEITMYFIIFVDIVLKIFRISKKDYHFFKWYLSLLIGILLYLLVESASFISIGYVALVFTIVFVVLPNSYYNHLFAKESVSDKFIK